MRQAGVSNADIDEVILVGADPHAKVQKRSEALRKEPNKTVNPTRWWRWRRGPGRRADRRGEGPLLLDVTPLSSASRPGWSDDALIEANTTIPTKKSESFTTASDSQPSVEVHVLQGERPMARDNRTLGRFHLDGIRLHRGGCLRSRSRSTSMPTAL